LEERSQHDWEAKEKHVFEELGGRVHGSLLNVGLLTALSNTPFNPHKATST
jgi:hypothetical protein